MRKSANDQKSFRMNLERQETDAVEEDTLGIDEIVVVIPLWRVVGKQLIIGSVLSILLSVAYTFFFNTPKEMMITLFSELTFVVGGLGILFGGVIHWAELSPSIRYVKGDRSMKVNKNNLRNGNAYLITSSSLIIFSFIIPGLFARL